MIEFINKYVFGAAVPVLLILAGIFYTLRLRAFHIFKLPSLTRALTRKSEGDGISPFRAVTLALAGTLGVGNIVGVAAAIGLGGYGSIFWMWISALCAMLLKYSEIVLAMRHRRYDPSGAPHGSAMHYIKDMFDSLSLPRIGKTVASVFALLCILNAISMGSMIQANAISESLGGVFGIHPLICGATLALTGGIIISRGTEGISKFTEILVPLMTLGYLIISIAVLIIRRDMLTWALSRIVYDAFSPEATAGGVTGFILSRQLRYGVMRGLISNEAGCGTAPAAHSSSNAKLPAEQGFWGIFEVFADTILLCTVTALVIIVGFDGASYGESWIMVTVRAYSAVLGGGAEIFLCGAVLCFGFATIICWAHYGIESVSYLSPRKGYKNLFIITYCASILVGAFPLSDAIWSVADFAIGAMTLINVSVICFMSREVKQETELYFAKASISKKARRIRAQKRR